MTTEAVRPVLSGARALVVGIANENSIAYAPILRDFDLLLNQAMERAPLGELVDIMDVGFACAYLATPYARRITGTTMYVDGGVNIMA